MMRDAALFYASLGWRIFRLTGYKTPFKGSHGFKDATTDANVITRWWTETPAANIGLATGLSDSGGQGQHCLLNIVVIDCDGTTALAEFTRLAAGRGGVPRTLAARTSKGWHFYFRLPADRRVGKSTAKRGKSGDDGIDVAGDKAYVLLPPSVNARTGFVYQWVNPPLPAVGGRAADWESAIAELPVWLEAWCTGRRKQGNLERRQGPAPEGWALPAGGQNTDRIGQVACPPKAGGGRGSLAARAVASLREGELPAFLEALGRVSAAGGYDDWFALGAAIHDFDPLDSGLAIFKRWSWSAAGYRDEGAQAACEAKWLEYGKARPPEAGARITKATVYARAREAEGERPVISPMLESAAPVAGTVNGHHSLPDVFEASAFGGPAAGGPIHWPDTDGDGNPRGTTTNAGLAIKGLGVACRRDAFHDRLTVGGQVIGQWAGELTDDAVLILRKIIKSQFGFDPGAGNCRDAAVQLCLENQFNPVVDYLASVERTWDGRERVGRWVVDYLGAEDTALNREFGRLFLIAAVRRARRPGVKFDQIIVLEGKEGINKSTALRILAGDANFSDQNILTASDRDQQEAVSGVWIYEIADLAGMRRADIDRVKQFASRTEDRARPAYGRFRLDKKRQNVFAGTTNQRTYLQSQTGNRRFWPIMTTTIALEQLRTDRDQLWAEAARAEAAGASIELHPSMWESAGEVQNARVEVDSWTDQIAHYLAKVTDDWRKRVAAGGIDEAHPSTSTTDILQLAMRLEPIQMNQVTQNRAAHVLQRLEWERYLQRVGSKRGWKYRPLGH